MHTRCPQCSTPVELSDDNETSQVSCSECGQAFDLLAETVATSVDGHGRSVGHFELLQLVGTGAFGAVWKAKDTLLDRFVAIKIPHSKQIIGKNAEQFFREARAAAQLKHANIVPVFEFGRHEHMVFMVSEFIEGVSLEDFLSAKKLSVREAAEMVATIASASGYAHAAGVIHRDLKPSNILLDKTNKPYIVDFGLAKREVGEMTVTMDGAILGTPLYMSPEQALGESHSVDARTDIYSLGVMLFRLLTHELPFRGNRPMLLHQIVHADPPTLRSLNSSVPRDMETITLKCLQKDRDKRYSSCAELVQDLRAFLNGEPIKARPTGPVEKAIRWCQRKPLVASLMAGLTISLMTGLLSVSVLWQRARQSASAAMASSMEATREAARAIDQENLTNQYLYVAQMNMVQEAWDRGLIDRSFELLARQRPTLRTFPWYYYNRIVERTRSAPNFEHAGIVTSIGFSPKQPHMAISGNDGYVDVWNFESKLSLSKFRADDTQLAALTTYSSDGKHLMWTGRDGKLVFYETDKYTQVDPIRITSGPWEVVLSSDGKHFAYRDEQGRAVVSEIGSSRDRVWEQFPEVRNMAFSADGSKLFVAHGDRAFSSFAVKDETAAPTTVHSPATIDTIAVADDGHWVATANTEGEVVLWKLEPLEPIRTVNVHNGGVRYLLFSSDSQTLATTGVEDRQMAFWNPSENGLSKKVVVHSGNVQLLSTIPGTQLFVTTIDEDNLIRVWDGVGTRAIEAQICHENSIYGLAVSSDGKFIASGGRGRNVKLIDRHAPALDLSIPAHEDWLWTLCFAESGRMLVTAAGDRSIRLWDSSTGKQLGVLIDPDLADKGKVAHAESIQCVLLLPDGDTLASASRDSTIKLWSIARQQLLARLPAGHQGAVNGLATAATGNYMYSIGDDGKVIQWDVEARTLKRVMATIEGVGWAIACAPDGKQLAAGGPNRMIEVWDTDTLRPLAQLRRHQAEVTSLTYSPDGLLLASTSADRTVQLHSMEDINNLPSGSVVKSIVLHGHSGDAMHAAFSPDGRTLATCGGDRTIRLWDLSTGEAVGLLKGHTNHIQGIIFDSTGTRLASASWDRTARIWWAPRDDQ
jgi:WD40 repeat protein/serine/threonine protein kinase